MGLEYKIEKVDRKLLDKATCDRCGKDIKKVLEGQWNQWGEPYSQFHEPYFEEFFLLKTGWGYHSHKDNQIHEAVICEDCYDIIFKDVKIKITHQFDATGIGEVEVGTLPELPTA
jgi:hypothetical protein